MGQIVLDTVVTVVNIGILAGIGFGCFKICQFVRRKNEMK